MTSSITTYHLPTLTLEDGEQVELTLTIYTDGPHARWDYLFTYINHFLEVFDWRKK